MSIQSKNHPNHKETILIREFSGTVNIEVILDSWKSILSSNLITDSTLGIINDLSKTQLDLDMEGFKRLMQYLKSQENLLKLKLAVLTSSPNIIVFPMLGANAESNLKIKPFTTEVAAIEWILASK